MEGPGFKPWNMDTGPMLLHVLVYYLDNFWKPEEGDDRRSTKEVQFWNSRKAIERPDASQCCDEEWG